MDNPSMSWLRELEMEGPDNIMKHQQTCSYYSESVHAFSSESFKSFPNVVTTNQSIHLATTSSDVDKQQDHKATNIDPFAPNHAPSSNTFTISFGNSTSPQENNHIYGTSKLDSLDAVMQEEETSLNQLLGSINVTTRSRDTRRNQRQAQEHVIAERKRREKLAERFVSLSALLPGLKKMDKATVLEDARKYIIQLQARVKELEETSHPRVSIGIPKFSSVRQDVVCSSNDKNKLPANSTFNPEIKARISGRKMLVRIYCTKSSSTILKTLTELERLHITIDCCSILPFNTVHLITIIAKMSDEMGITAKYLVKCLQSTLRDSH